MAYFMREEIMETQFKEGDIVVLKSGSDLMTVQSVGGDLIECVWFDQQGKLQSSKFKTVMLKKAESDGGGGSTSFQPE